MTTRGQTEYCRQHGALLCQICQEQDRKKCQDPKNIRESSDELNADPELQPVPEQSKSAGEMPVVRPEKKPYVEQSLYIRIPEDKANCQIFDCCPLSDGSLVVADCNNRRLKFVDPSHNKVAKYCPTEGSPSGICCIGPQEVAVAIFGSTEVQVYNTISLTRTRTVELGHETNRIAYHGGLLYCAGWPKTLYVHEVSSGRKLREISFDTDGLGLFSAITHIAVNSSGDRVFVADWWKGLVCVGVDGRPIFCLSEKVLGLTDAWGVTTDNHGHVFVCGQISQNVVKVTEDGVVEGQILSKEDGMTVYPDCLSYDVSRNSLYVGGLDSDQLLMVEWK